ncbi:MAG: hypothetical protein LC799_07170, partial [Actinobacteria bacterium]|nr:hypothetical protein [Actinomycetota bacterium]
MCELREHFDGDPIAGVIAGDAARRSRALAELAFYSAALGVMKAQRRLPHRIAALELGAVSGREEVAARRLETHTSRPPLAALVDERLFQRYRVGERPT